MKEGAASKGLLTQVSAVGRFFRLEIQMCHGRFEDDIGEKKGNLPTIKHPARKCHVETISM